MLNRAKHLPRPSASLVRRGHSPRLGLAGAATGYLEPDTL